ncbi:AsnC family transcriptional regulator [Halobaculum sp. MBLA0147]|uniref:AsnC family transcriptional regulator n=1 Tax=Halobaculum sp. MBLA0147 TaxID=3079934 RepID=UPI0035259E81
MRELDETDVSILRLLAEDGRRSYSEIGEVVDLTPPAVSDRVTRLEDAGVIRQFTIDVDRSTLRSGTPVLVRVEPEPDARAAVRERLLAADAAEHVFTTAEGEVVVFARTPTTAVHDWLVDTVGAERLLDAEVDLVADAEWTPAVDTVDFAFDCAECDNTVTSEGTSAEIGEELRHFCCSSCESAFRDRYERMADGADEPA